MTSLSVVFSSVVDYHHGNLTPTIIVWTLAGLIGAFYTARNLRDSLRDAEALGKSTTPHNRRHDLVALAHQAIRQDAIRLSQMLAVVGIGVAVALTTPTISDEQRAQLHIPYWTPTSITLTVALLYIVASIAIQAYLDRRIRDRIYNGDAP